MVSFMLKMVTFVNMLRKLMIPVALCVAMQTAAGQGNVKKQIESLVTDGQLKGAVVGVCVMDADGKVLTEYNSNVRMTPASNLKLVTTGAALYAFGPEYRFKTQIGYTGYIDKPANSTGSRNGNGKSTDSNSGKSTGSNSGKSTATGTLHGDIIIIGGGDPTIGAKDSTAYKADALFWKWKTILQNAGITRIDGSIIGDGTAYEGYLEHPAWEHADTWTYFGTGTNALSFYENTIDLEVGPGAAKGAPVTMRQVYPETPWLSIVNNATTGPKDTGNSLYMQTSPLSATAVLTGTYPIDKRPKTEQAANKNGALTCAHEFYKNLLSTGWDVTDTYGYATDSEIIIYDQKEGPSKAEKEPVTVIGETLSPTLAQIARRTNVSSDNFYAEAIFRAMGEAASGKAVYDSCLVAINDVLEDIVPGTKDGIIQKDGSGLARGNSVSPGWMAGFLNAMKDNAAFVASLPRPGEGTLFNLNNLRPWKYRFKSGSMGGVLCYSGYILDQNGKPAKSFCILTNNLGCTQQEARAALEALIQEIGKN